MTNKQNRRFTLTAVPNADTEPEDRALRYELRKAGYVEVADVRVLKNEIDVKDFTFEDRLKNWGHVMSKVRVSKNVTASWAADYISNRNAMMFRVAIAHGLISKPSLVDQIEVQALSDAAAADAWEIESAWAQIGDFNQRQAMKMLYVQRLNEGYIRRKLKLRGSRNVELLLWRARTCLQQVLARKKNEAIIHTYNLTAATRA